MRKRDRYNVIGVTVCKRGKWSRTTQLPSVVDIEAANGLHAIRIAKSAWRRKGYKLRGCEVVAHSEMV